MKCENCRRVNQAGSKFCDKCGQPLQPSLRLEKKERTSSKKGLWLGLAAIIILVATAVALFLTIPNYNKLQKALDEVQSGEDFYQLLTIDGVSATEQKAQQAFWQQRNAAPAVKMGLTALRGGEGNALGVIGEPLQVERSKKLGIFEHYRITPLAVAVEATTNVSPVVIKVAGKDTSLTANEPTALGELLPGSYDYQVLWDSPFGKVEETRTLITDNEGIDATFDFYTVTLADAEGRELDYFVDDAPFDATLLTGNELIVPKQQSFSLHATFDEDGVTHTSDKLTIKDGVNHVTFTYPTYNNTAKAEEEAKATILRYLDLYTAGAFNRLGEVISANSAFLGSQTKYLSGLNKQGISVNLMSYDVLSFQELGNDSYRLNVNETFVVNEPGKYSKTVKQNVTYDITNFGGDFLITNYQFNKK